MVENYQLSLLGFLVRSMKGQEANSLLSKFTTSQLKKMSQELKKLAATARKELERYQKRIGDLLHKMETIRKELETPGSTEYENRNLDKMAKEYENCREQVFTEKDSFLNSGWFLAIKNAGRIEVQIDSVLESRDDYMAKNSFETERVGS